jgi:hypothetical protein
MFKTHKAEHTAAERALAARYFKWVPCTQRVRIFTAAWPGCGGASTLSLTLSGFALVALVRVMRCVLCLCRQLRDIESMLQAHHLVASFCAITELESLSLGSSVLELSASTPTRISAYLTGAVILGTYSCTQALHAAVACFTCVVPDCLPPFGMYRRRCTIRTGITSCCPPPPCRHPAATLPPPCRHPAATLPPPCRHPAATAM